MERRASPYLLTSARRASERVHEQCAPAANCWLDFLWCYHRMSLTTTIDLGSIAQGLGLGLARVESAVRLLDEGNTVPFITRYRKDQTGGLDEEQIREIEARRPSCGCWPNASRRSSARSSPRANSRPSWPAAIDAADDEAARGSVPAVQAQEASLATLARERSSSRWPAKFSAATKRRRSRCPGRRLHQSRQAVTTAADVLLGVRHILAEDFSERADLRERLREMLQRRPASVVSTNSKSKQNRRSRNEAAADEPKQPEETTAERQPRASHRSRRPKLGAAGEVAPTPTIPAAQGDLPSIGPKMHRWPEVEPPSKMSTAAHRTRLQSPKHQPPVAKRRSTEIRPAERRDRASRRANECSTSDPARPRAVAASAHETRLVYPPPARAPARQAGPARKPRRQCRRNAR